MMACGSKTVYKRESADTDFRKGSTMLIEFFKVSLILLLSSLGIGMLYSVLDRLFKKQRLVVRSKAEHIHSLADTEVLASSGSDLKRVEPSLSMADLVERETLKDPTEVFEKMRSEVGASDFEVSEKKSLCHEQADAYQSFKNIEHLDDTSRTQLISVYVLANPNQTFSGYHLLQTLLSCGLRYGRMNIFHYHQSNQNHSILFSLASAMEPGTFDIHNMGAFSGSGLCLFMPIQGIEQDRTVFEIFLRTTQKISDELNGTVYDADRHPLTKETVVSYQAMIDREKLRSEPFELAE